jgi:hypothetical protein
MKKFAILIVCIAITTGSALQAQEKRTKKERQQEQMENVQKMVDTQDYKFVAQHAIPMSGRSISLTSVYDMSVKLDTIHAHLPYYGRAYVAPMDPTEGGIKFNTTNFEYRLEQAKKGGWTAYITVDDAQRRYNLVLSITSSGYATLSVSDPTRQTISFNGYIEEQKN